MSHPYLIVIGGFAGAGKSTLARRLGRTLALPYYEIDLVARAIADSPDFQGTNSKGVAFDLFWVFARTHLENGNSLIFDQNMGQSWQWNQIKHLCALVPNATLITFILDCPYDLCIERFEARTEHPDLGDVDIHDHKYKWDYLNDNEFTDAIRIDATRSQDEVFAEVVTHLRPKWRRPKKNPKPECHEKKPGAVLFDFHNTIVKRVTFDPEMGIRALLKLAKKPSSISIQEALVRYATLDSQLSAVWKTSDVWSTEQQFHKLLFDGLGISFEVTPDELEQCFFEAATAFEPMEGIQTCLSRLHAYGIRLGVVSNEIFSGASLQLVLGRLGIADPFEFVVSSADYGIGKPHPLIFEAAVAKIGVEHSMVWFVGDSLKADIAGANEAGLFSVWYNPNENNSGDIAPNARVRSWKEFMELIEMRG